MNGPGNLEFGVSKMEPEMRYPETGVARVRSDPSCAGQARGRAGPNILIDVRPTLAGTPYLRQGTQAIENN